MIFILAAGVVGFRKPLLRSYALFFAVNDPAPSDAILLLMGGVDHRPKYAAKLYREGLAPVILMGEIEPNAIFPETETELCRKILLAEGVPAESILVMPGGYVDSTHDEALRLKAFVQSSPRRIHRVTVVTTAFHSRRARRVVRRTLEGLGVDVRAASCPEPRFDETNWQDRELGLIYYFEETIKSVLYYFKY